MKQILWILVLSLCLVAVPAAAERITLVEDFEDIQPGEDDQRGWTFGVFSSDESVVQKGGGGHVLEGHIDNFGVNLLTKSDGSNPWVGNADFRADGVIRLGFSTRGRADFGNSIRNMAVALISDNGTPEDSSDDFGFYSISERLYNFDTSERANFRWEIPSQVAGETPEGWQHWDLSGGGDTSFTWDEVVTDVDRIQFTYYDPQLFYIFQGFDVMVDNIKMVIETDLIP
jgi:hypothetical protein